MISEGFVYAQTIEHFKEKNTEFSIQAGYWGRSSSLRFERVSYYQRSGIIEDFHTRGTGISTGVKYKPNIYRPSYEVNLISRYDHVGIDGSTGKENKAWLFDISLAASIVPFPNNQWFYIGLQGGINNLFKEVEAIIRLPDGKLRKDKINLQYLTYGIHAGILLWNIGIEPRLHLVPSNSYPFASNNDKVILLLSGAVYYNIGIH